MTKRAWIVGPELIDRFLNIFTTSGFKWISGHKANQYKIWFPGETILFIEDASKIISCKRLFPYPDNWSDSDEELNITEVTEEWLKDNEYKNTLNIEGDNVETLNKMQLKEGRLVAYREPNGCEMGKNKKIKDNSSAWSINDIEVAWECPSCGKVYYEYLEPSDELIDIIKSEKLEPMSCHYCSATC